MNDAAEQLEKYDGILDRIIFKPEICELVGLGGLTLDKMEKVGEFPKRVRVGRRRTGWRLSDLRKWFDNLEKVAVSETAGE